MIRMLRYLLAALLIQSHASAEPLAARLSIHKGLRLQDLTPVYQKAPKFGLGFKTLTLEDPWHPNTIVLDYKPYPKNRRILANIWYPAAPHKNFMPHSAYYEVSELTDSYTKTYLEYTRRFRRLLQYQESLAQTGTATNTPILIDNAIDDPEAFARQVPALRNAAFAEGHFPVAFYHSGAQGGFEENAPLFEYLAYQGIVVVSVIGPTDEGGIDASSRSIDLLWNDVNLVLAELQRNPHIDTARTAFFGFSAGAQRTLSFMLDNHTFAAAVLFDTTSENKDFMGFPDESAKRLEERGSSIHTPILILSEIGPDFGKNDRFRIYGPLKNAPALLVDFGKDALHDDFIWHGLINRASQKELDRTGFDRAMQRYRAIGDLTLDFLSEAFSDKPDWSRLPMMAKAHLSDDIYRRSQVGSLAMNPRAKIVEILASEPKVIESLLKALLAQRSISVGDINTLIQHVRYTYSSAKALSFCKALPLANLTDPVNCMAIALESHEVDSAKMFADYFFKTRKKPGKKADFFKRIQYSDAEKLKEMIGKAQLKGTANE